MAKICVTGAAGFIGGHLAEELLRQGHEVAGLERSSPAASGRTRPLLSRHPGFTLVEGSIADPDRSASGRGRRDPGYSTWPRFRSVPLSVAEPERTNAVNVGGTVNLLEISARRAGVQRVVLACSCAAYATGPSSQSTRAWCPGR